ncbi:AP-3 complex subunit delta [Neolecta irregularis DAH-3]|uniref:AP-3 complex subunit delta n=1 Tax=Neolecta irregularis (strain DAH-3) TaxID=1198029 RepID=A0A1U7LSK2_NEOID|nr:AP-3 complex subunit delta [Neolecta irregularis DAH-3]|eukprot:OLL25522.1 AP-3 complex subunit delta [Neolecta irregularis DAH-3]
MKSLNSLIKGFRACKDGGNTEYIVSAIAQCRNEVKSQDPDIKATAILKLVWLEMMGYDLSWASFHIVEVMSSPKYLQKRIGYLAAVQSFNKDTDVLMLTTNLIKKDLNSSNPLEISIAINGLSHIVTPSLARDLNHDLLSMLSHSRPFVRKKAVLVLYKIFLQYPEALRIAFPRLQEKLDDPDPSVVGATVNVVCELARKAPKNYLVLAPQLFNLLTTSQNNWMLIKIIKLFTALTPLEPRLVKKLVPQLTHILQTSSAMSLLYEAINTVVSGGMLSGPNGDALATMCVSKLCSFFEEPDQNLHYVGLLALARIAPTHNYLLADMDGVILDCIDDSDMSIRLRALDLVHLIADKRTLPDIVKRLIRQLLPSSTLDISPFYRVDVVHRILELGKKDSFGNISNFEWFVATLVDLTKISNCEEEIAQEIINVAIRVRSVRPFVVAQMERLISEGVEGNVCFAVGWIVGEYCSFLRDPVTTIHYLSSPPTGHISTDIQAIYVHALAKVYTHYVRSSQEWTVSRKSSLQILTEKIISSLSQFTTSSDLELQERAVQFSSIFNLALEFLSSAPVGEILHDNGFEDGKPPRFITETMTELFGLYELAPVGPSAQARVPLPQVDLNEWIVRPSSPDPVFVEQDEENDLIATKVPRDNPQDKERKEAERRERIRDDPFYIDSLNPTIGTPAEIDVDSIPIMELDLGTPKVIVKSKKKKSRRRDISPPRVPVEIIQEEMPEGADYSSISKSAPKPTETKKSLLHVDASKLLDVDFERDEENERLREEEERASLKAKKLAKMEGKPEMEGKSETEGFLHKKKASLILKMLTS